MSVERSGGVGSELNFARLPAMVGCLLSLFCAELPRVPPLCRLMRLRGSIACFIFCYTFTLVVIALLRMPHALPIGFHGHE